MTKVITKRNFKEIVNALHNDCIVALPTDTVYGIGVLCSSKIATEKMKTAKIRPESKPFPVMVASLEQLEQIAYLNQRERMIVEQFTPGGLTLILNKKDIIDNGVDTIAVRIPNDKFLLRLLKAVGPMFVTSANISGQPACNTDEEVLAQLNNRIEYIVKGKAVSKVASTIIDCTKEDLVVLRQGELALDEIKKALM